MFDVAPTELLLVAIVALLVIGPKDLPKAMRFVGHWVGKARGVARQFRSGFDSMVREAELADMEKKWAEENARIMREHPPTPTIDAPPALPAPEGDATYHFEPDPYSREPVFDSPDEPRDVPAPEPTPPPAIRPAFSDRSGGAA